MFTVLDSNDIKYTVEENEVERSVIWFRTVSDISVESCRVVKEEREEIETVMIVLIPNKDFLNMVHSSVMRGKGKQSNKVTLLEYISNLKASFPEMTLTCVTVGFAKYVRDLKEGSDSELKTVAKQVPKTASEEVIIEVQLQAFVNFNFVESMTDLGSLLCRFTKAVAEAPQRREKQKQKAMAFSWFADADSSCPVKTSKDGSGLIELWRQQIKQFQNVGAEIAEAIASKYPSPQLLIQAYKHCSTIKEKETLLQDIVVRRNYGPLGTQRRIGPELSYKIYLFFSSRDGDQVLQR
ncbi:crossover junction endonuclease EME1-like [Uloborus diversus]|uniref:crossover junction endonuclease EME1-like n=1 Tax=Uloborus diversus TaxID=327109 RepID=UPI002409EC8C|nr:crossover junction endonuclease EME1-like [Uloborus diversus]